MPAFTSYCRSVVVTKRNDTKRHETERNVLAQRKLRMRDSRRGKIAKLEAEIEGLRKRRVGPSACVDDD